MLQKFLLVTTVSVAALVGMSQISIANAEDATSQTVDQTALDAQVSAIEALVLQFKDDPDGLQAAIEQYVTSAADPELAANAVLFVAQNSNNLQVKAALESNSGLTSALGNGLGAAISTIALTNPDLATKLTANVVATGNTSLIASVQNGADTKTASVNEQQHTNDSVEQQDSTPENPASSS